MIDMDMQKDKISRLEQEIEDLSSHDVTDNKEVIHFTFFLKHLTLILIFRSF